MIEIRTKLTDFVYKYRGNIELTFKEPVLMVEADYTSEAGDIKYDERVFDGFWITDIISIKGVENGSAVRS